MKIYLKNFDASVAINILNYQQITEHCFDIDLMINNKPIKLFLKEGRTKNFFSTDAITWNTFNKNGSLPSIAIGDQLFNLHNGFIPNKQGDEQEGALIAKMPGKVVKIIKHEGDVIQKGEALLIIEAMKMENEIKANCSGIIEKIHVVAGQSINSGEPLITLKNEINK